MVNSFFGEGGGDVGFVSAVKAADSTDSEAVARKMRELRVNDAYNEEVEIRQDGRVLHGSIW